MPDIAEQDRFDEFLPKARAYLAAPSLMAGLELNEMIVRLRQYAISGLGAPDLGRDLESMLGAVRNQDVKELGRLLESVESALAARRQAR